MALVRDGYHHTSSWVCRLTELERRILRDYASGMNRRQIGARLGLSERTIGNYLTVAKEKLGAENLIHAAVLSVRQDEISLNVAREGR